VKKTFLIVAALVSFTAFAFAGDVPDIMIDVAPNVLNLQRPGDYVTVHTDIPYSLVEAHSVELEVGENEPISIYRWKSDDRGYFVAKFKMSDVLELDFAIDDDNTFTLIGNRKDGAEFWGTQDILVVDNVPINDPKGPR